MAALKAKFQKEEVTVSNSNVNPNNTVLTGATLEQSLPTVPGLAYILNLQGGRGSK